MDAPGRDRKTLGGFFDALGRELCQQITLVSADGAEWIAAVVAARGGNATVWMDPFHAVKARHEAPCIRRRVRDPPLRLSPVKPRAA